MRYILFVALLSTLGFAEPETYESAPSFVRHETGLKLEKGWSKSVKFRSALDTKALSLPRHFDWRENGTLTPVKDQGSCGSCWSFSGVGAIESAIALRDKKIVDLSEQYLLSCNTKGWSCNGGGFPHDMHVSPGAALESEFPYVGKQVACKQGISHPYKIDSWAYVPSASEDDIPDLNEIKAAIYQFGPISAAVAANDKMQSYKSGVFNSCDSTQPNHAIVIVGWDDDGQYFIVRNSWGNNFGINGYINIKYGCNYIGIASNYIVYKGGNPSPTPTPTPVPPGPSPTPKPTPTPNPNPVPPSPQPVPKCTPQAQAYAGPNLRIYSGQIVTLGSRPLSGTSYIWEVNGRVYQEFRTSQIRAKVFRDAIFTVYATTRCGVARSSAMVIVNQRR